MIILSHVRRCLTNHKYGLGPSPAWVIDGGRCSLVAGRWSLVKGKKPHARDRARPRQAEKTRTRFSPFFLYFFYEYEGPPA